MSFTSKRFNRFMATGTTAALVATAIVPVVSANELTLAAFTDVAPQYEDAIDYIVKNNIAKGLSGSQFGVKEEIIRGDAAIMIAQAVGLMNENAPVSGFKDVPARGRLAVNSLKAAGVINGKSATEFDFQSEITRGEAALMLAKAYKLTANKESLIFTDVVGTRYDDAVSALIENEVTNGISTTQFGTLKNIKRGDFARFLYRLAEEKVDDTEAPVLSYGGDTNLTIKIGEELSWPTVTVKDNIDSKVKVDLLITDKTGKVIPQEEFNTSITGTYQLLYTAVDAAGNKSESITVTLLITDMVPPVALTFLELNTPYVSSDNKMTVTMENLKVVDMGDFYEVQLTYKEQNNTTDQVIDQGAFKIFYANGESEPQYGFFNKLYPGEESTRSYTFKTLKSQEILAIEYGADLFFKQQPTEETLKWNIVNQ